MKKKTVSIITLGCPKNLVDSEKLASDLQLNGTPSVHEQDLAEIIVINTCAFIGDAQQEAIDTILHYVQLKKEGKIEKIIVTGCLSQRFKEELKVEIPEVDHYYGVNEYKEVIKEITKKEEQSNQRILGTPSHYAYLKIAEGCDHQCSFCIIPAIRGKYKSRPFEDIIEEAKELSKNGVKELIVIAQDTTYYGVDLYKKRRIAELMQSLAKIEGFHWIRLMYTYPLSFPMDLATVIAEEPKIAKYIDMPLQHIDDEILQDMKRPLFEDEIKKLISNLRLSIPELHIRSAFIAGYPGETSKKFDKLKKLLSEVKFERLGLFSYSPESGTPAGEQLKQIGDKTRLRRTAELMSIHEKNSSLYSQTMKGRILTVMVDEVPSEHLAHCRSQWDAPEIDHIIYVETSRKVQAGELIKIKVLESGIYDLTGIMLD